MTAGTRDIEDFIRHMRIVARLGAGDEGDSERRAIDASLDVAQPCLFGEYFQFGGLEGGLH